MQRNDWGRDSRTHVATQRRRPILFPPGGVSAYREILVIDARHPPPPSSPGSVLAAAIHKSPSDSDQFWPVEIRWISVCLWSIFKHPEHPKNLVQHLIQLKL